MPQTLENTARIIKLNGQHIVRHYNAEISTTICTEDNTSTTKLGMYFTLTLLDSNNGNLQYRMEVQKRFFLDNVNFAIQKLSKAQQLVLKVASINDTLEFEVDIHLKHLKVINTHEIQKHWKKIKESIQAEFVDMDDLINDFDWQLQHNIQQSFLSDNFFNFFFANIFYKEFENDTPIIEHKTISNALANLDLPIIEQKSIQKRDVIFSDITIKTEAQIDTENKKFPLAKLNVFLGDLADSDSQHSLDFKYSGTYHVIPPKGLVTQGKLNYSFEINNIYKKTTTINFNLKQDEQ